MDGLGQDLRLAVRLLRKTPGFTAAALLTLALGIGANSALFSLVDAVLLRPLPFGAPERLHAIWSHHTSTPRYPFSLPEFCDYRDQTRTLEALAALAGWSANLAGDGPTERLVAMRVTGNLYDLLGARAAVGRTLLPADDTPGHERVVVLSHGLWQRRFGGDPGIVGRSVALNGEAYQVVGVLERDFLYPVRDVELAVPLAPEQDPWLHNRESTNFLRLLGRARPGLTAAQVEADLESIASRLQAQYPDTYARKQGVTLLSLHEELTRNVAPALWMLQAAVGLLLLIACANLANLMLARANERSRELAIRRSLGARGRELGRQFLCEALLLALGGGVLGLALARAALPALVAASPTSMPRAAQISLHPPVVAFTLLASLVAGIAFGVVPALRASRVDAGLALRAESRGTVGSASRGRARGLILTAQLALMVVLLSGAGLLLKSFRQVMKVEPGFDPQVLSLRLALPRKDYAELARLSAFYRQLEARVKALPGVTAVAAVNHVPLNGAIASADYKVEGAAVADESRLPTAVYRLATPDYFRTIGIPLAAGRAFGEDDGAGSEPVAIVSRALARRSFGATNPIGRHLLVKDSPAGFRPLRIVGVAGDVHHASLETEPEPHVYVPYHQTPRDLLVWIAQTQFLLVRTAGPPEALGESVRRELQAVDAGVASAELRTTGFYVEAATASRRFTLGLLLAFAALALLLAAIGIYGVASYGVAQRSRETGVRLALGARPRDILALVLRDGLRRACLGVGPGLVLALLVGRALRGLLYGVEAHSPDTYAIVAALLVAVTLVAHAVPARRAAALDPTAALRLD